MSQYYVSAQWINKATISFHIISFKLKIYKKYCHLAPMFWQNELYHVYVTKHWNTKLLKLNLSQLQLDFPIQQLPNVEKKKKV